MDSEIIKRKKGEIIEQWGPWTNHNIRLHDDVYTIREDALWSGVLLRRIIQVISDVACRPLDKLRVLDLGCLEGLFAIELARHGAEVVGIEGRQANIEKARFAQDVLSLDNLQLVQDDVRNLSREKYGNFDVILCLGLLYHLDVPDVFYFVRRMADTCNHFAIIDTHISLAAEKRVVYEGKTYCGTSYKEHSPKSTAKERAKALWASLDNPTSFWLTRPSLLNLLSDAGFTSVYECRVPPLLQHAHDRITLLAIKGQRQAVSASPTGPEERWPEKFRLLGMLAKGAVRIARAFPQEIRGAVKKLVP